MPSIAHRHVPDTLRAEAEDDLPGQIVFVECGAPWLAEVEWVEQLAATEPRIRGIVAKITIDAGLETTAAIEELRKHPLVRGVRHNFEHEAPDYCARPEFIRGGNKVGAAGLSFDVCCIASAIASGAGARPPVPGGELHSRPWRKARHPRRAARSVARTHSALGQISERRVQVVRPGHRSGSSTLEHRTAATLRRTPARHVWPLAAALRRRLARGQARVRLPALARNRPGVHGSSHRRGEKRDLPRQSPNVSTGLPIESSL